MTKTAHHLCVPMDCKRGDAHSSQDTTASRGWVIQATTPMPRDTSVYTQCKVHNGNLLGGCFIFVTPQLWMWCVTVCG